MVNLKGRSLTRPCRQRRAAKQTFQCSLLGLLFAILLASCTPQTPSAPPLDTTTPAFTLTPSLTPSPTPSPSPTPTATPIPEVRVENGEEALFNGDYARAHYEFQIAFNTSTEAEVQAAALWGLGRVEHFQGNNASALMRLRLLASNYSSSPYASRAYFLMGEIYSSLLRYAEAAQAYAGYLSLRPGVIDYYVQERLGDALRGAGNHSEAITAYQAALNAPHITDDTALRIKLADTFASSGDYAAALGLYDNISANSQNDYVKAQIALLTGRIYYYKLGETDLAHQRFLDAVNNYPASYDSYSALEVLINDGVPVDDLNRGLVYFFARQYGLALQTFNRYIANNPQHDGTASYYIARTLREQGQYQEAVNEYTKFIASYPLHWRWRMAWEEKAYTQWAYLDQYEEAAQTLRDFIRQVSDSGVVPAMMLRIGYIYKYGGLLDQAASAWEELANLYPANDSAAEALFEAGVARYRLQQYPQALVLFLRDAQFSSKVEDQARAYFWAAKTQQALGDASAAQASWQQAAMLDPLGYYGLRAEDMLLNRLLFESPLTYDLNIDWTREQREAEAWLRVTFGLPPETDLAAPGPLGSDPRLIRGTELWLLGLEEEAYAEFENLRLALNDDAPNLFRLATYLLDVVPLYRPAIFAMRQVLTLAGMSTQAQTLAAPRYFNHVRYGLYYQELILKNAQQYGFAPLFLFSVMRQESLFDKNAVSGDGAIGLMQIMPATGQALAERLGWPANYVNDDLYRPLVNIQLGAYFLMHNRNFYDGDLFAALARYNAAPYYADVWKDLSNNDIDLFVEVIGNQQTRDYIRSIYEHYWMYRRLYTTLP